MRWCMFFPQSTLSHNNNSQSPLRKSHKRFFQGKLIPFLLNRHPPPPPPGQSCCCCCSRFRQPTEEGGNDEKKRKNLGKMEVVVGVVVYIYACVSKAGVGVTSVASSSSSCHYHLLYPYAHTRHFVRHTRNFIVGKKCFTDETTSS